ncbi:MAG: Flp pilus assembly protein CpaB [Deltaproteobacteria bacterium]|nr:Flp pilus assembly protein CpaB [Deltaproteobacteria bacterium]
MLKGKLPVIIALLMGGTAVFGGYTVIRMQVKEKTAGWQLEPVLAAAQDIQSGTRLNQQLITVKMVPRRFIFESMIKPNEKEAILSQEVVGNIKKGEPIHWYQLRGNLESDTLSKAVPKKARAITISVTERSAVGQMIRPADHVDVLGTFRDPNTNRMIAVTLLQNEIILATGHMRANSIASGTSGRADSYSTITLQVLPEEAEILVLAQDLGNLYLTLRNAEDSDLYEERARTTIDTLITGERIRKAHFRRMHTFQRVNKIIRGIKKGRYPYDKK